MRSGPDGWARDRERFEVGVVGVGVVEVGVVDVGVCMDRTVRPWPHRLAHRLPHRLRAMCPPAHSTSSAVTRGFRITRCGYRDRMDILWIILIVVIVLVLLGGIGFRGRR
jgi:hypothetical protein